MKRTLFFIAAVALASSAFAQQRWEPRNTEYYHNQPPIITPGEGTKPPSDAIILFDGKDLSAWESTRVDTVNRRRVNRPAEWEVKDGCFTVVRGKGDIQTKEVFGDCQLHIEWRAAVGSTGTGQGRSNSGVFMQSTYEVQVLDCYDNVTYSNGQTGSIYKQTQPLVNACRKPGEWQTYDIIYKAPVFNYKEELVSPAYITVIHNGVVIQNHTEIKGDTPYVGLPKYVPHGRLPIKLQDHGDPVSFRNVWIRNL
ncbi:MAG: DUF1080 domain-containing protein [Bacteroidales bacterium]